MILIPPKTYTPVADYFIGLSNETGTLISNLKLQKLLYYADAWHLANYGDPLIKEDFQAWVHGPVIPALYGQYKSFGYHPIQREELNEEACLRIKQSFSKDQQELLGLVTDSYFGLTAFELERLTHNELPWQLARKGLADDEPSNNIIDKSAMRKYYAGFINGSQNK